MKKTGQIVLVSISILFTAFQTIFFKDSFFSIDFFIATIIAWIVGWQYDRTTYFGNEIKKSEENYKQLIETLPESVIIHQNNQIVYVNKSAVKLVGAYSKSEVEGKSIYEFTLQDYKERVKERMVVVLKEERPLSSNEYKIKRLDGRKIFFEASSLHIMFGGKDAILTIGKDVTSRKQRTEQLLQKSEKLALVGQMAAGLAHEIRNPLTSIKGFIQLFKSNYNRNEYYDLVLAELDRINLILGEFLVLAKPTAVIFKETNIKTIIKDVVTLVNTQSILNNVQIFVEFDTNIPPVSCEENQLKQVFINIIKNAIEAMPTGGIIEVKVNVKSESEITISIVDQGIGIPAERLQTLGEPFYTTKEKGTGLGLMTCFKIIENHNGHIHVTSEVNQGTTFEVILPTLTHSYSSV
ncbi:ATP-binding protein [Ferdinandcohnia quinoae]|uniref:histidine kinase n=1 Tax=Fredinandcohnia quinoae TaxID=2918902 RepID=A0AAW5E9H7_9BACI|nr:ATP-binding protein [Fredinandcohnia sp. SECRCQ15]MCH1626667.1 ATP-binding protein [Fredinandcohnia sp. SECRCQ15]